MLYCKPLVVRIQRHSPNSCLKSLPRGSLWQGYEINWASLVAGKESACSAGDPGSIPGSGRSPGGGHGNPLQYSCLENPHGQRSLAGYRLWGHKESDMTERLSTHEIRSILGKAFIWLMRKCSLRYHRFFRQFEQGNLAPLPCDLLRVPHLLQKEGKSLYSEMGQPHGNTGDFLKWIKFVPKEELLGVPGSENETN